MKFIYENHLKELNIPFSNDEIHLMINTPTPTMYKKGALMVEQGAKSDILGFLSYGIMRLFYKIGDKEFTTKYFFPGEWVSEYHSVATGMPAIYYIEAIIDCGVMIIQKKELDALYDNSHMIERYGRLMAERTFITIVREKAARAIKTPEALYLDLVGLHPEVLEAVPLKQVANYLNIQPGSLSRIRRRLAKGTKV